jgi:chitinase
MGYILDLDRWGEAPLDSLDFTATDYVIHAFYTADGAGNVVSVDPIVDKYRSAGLVEKVHNAGGRIVMSLGGANHSFPLKQVAASPSLRATFAANVVQKINEWGYDGAISISSFRRAGANRRNIWL